MAVAVIVILIIVLIVVAVLLVRVCKHRALGSSSSFSDKITSIDGSMTALQAPCNNVTMSTVIGNGKVAPVACKMPKHIQMGTGFRTIPQQQQQQQKPDLLTEASAHNMSRNSVNTTTTTSLGKPESTSSHGSYKMAMENIIDDYGRR